MKEEGSNSNSGVLIALDDDNPVTIEPRDALNEPKEDTYVPLDLTDLLTCDPNPTPSAPVPEPPKEPEAP